MSDSDEEVLFEKKGLFEYEDQIPYEKRFAESQRILEKYPSRIPLVCERIPEHIQKTSLPTLSKKKFLVPGAMTLAQFAQVVKKQVADELESGKAGGNGSSGSAGYGSGYGGMSSGRKNAETKALYFSLRSRRSPAMTKTLDEIYHGSKDGDGFLYLHFCEENVFGMKLDADSTCICA